MAETDPHSEVLKSIRRIKTLKELTSWLQHHVMSMAFPPPPWTGNDWIKPVVSVTALKEASLRFKNCSYGYKRSVLLGNYYFYISDRGPAIIGVELDPIVGWRIDDITGPHNQKPDKSVLEEIRPALAAEFCDDNMASPCELWDDDAGMFRY